MSAIIMPEVVIYYTVEGLLKFLRNDLTAHESDPENTYLNKLFGTDDFGRPTKLNTYDFFLQAKKMLQNPNALKVFYGYNPETVGKNDISLHIILPNESDDGSAIGESEGYMDTPADRAFSQRFRANYQLMITSVNSSEVLTIYHLLKCMFLAVHSHWGLMGLELGKLSGSDIVFESDLIPNMIFHKVINFEFSYELTVPQLITLAFSDGLLFKGTPLDNIYGVQLPDDPTADIE